MTTKQALEDKLKYEREDGKITRQRMYEYICANPGVYFMQVVRHMDLETSPTLHNLNRLEGAGLIKRYKDGHYTRYFDASYDKPIRPLSNEDRILEVARRNPDMNLTQIGKELGLSRQVVSYHTLKLKKKGLWPEHL